MDISLTFKASVRKMISYNKVTSILNTLPKCKRQSLFSSKTQIITNFIVQLQKLLLENRQAYINFCNYVPTKIKLTDTDCIEIDTLVESIIHTCLKLIEEFNQDIIKFNTSAQYQEHCEITVSIIQNYLKYICKLYSEQKSMRLKKIIEAKKLSKLKSLTKLNKKIKPININNNSQTNESISNKTSLKIQEINGDMIGMTLNEQDQFSSEDIQMFRTENEQLYNELNAVSEEVKQIESKVVHITELQEIFTEKVLHQNKNLDCVLTTVIGSTENVKEANEHIRKAIQRNAGLRVWVLFFLLIMSFTLIFLDWYNP